MCRENLKAEIQKQDKGRVRKQESQTCCWDGSWSDLEDKCCAVRLRCWRNFLNEGPEPIGGQLALISSNWVSALKS